MNESITVETLIQAPIERVWEGFTNPEAVKAWNQASADWHTTKAENDLKVGGRFLYRMEAKDGSAGFDFVGVYDEVVPHKHLSYTMEDGRKVEIIFQTNQDNVRVIETFEPETQNTHEMQQAGWQAILNNFKRYTESSETI